MSNLTQTVAPFSKAAFMAAPGDDARVRLCHDLANVLTEVIRSDREFHPTAYRIIDALQAIGHDLWSFDESDYMQAWCPNYAQPSGCGICVVFTPEKVSVDWSPSVMRGVRDGEELRSAVSNSPHIAR